MRIVENLNDESTTWLEQRLAVLSDQHPSDKAEAIEIRAIIKRRLLDVESKVRNAREQTEYYARLNRGEFTRTTGDEREFWL